MSAGHLPCPETRGILAIAIAAHLFGPEDIWKAKQISCNAHAQTKMVLADGQACLRISLRSVKGASHSVKFFLYF